MQLPPRSPKLNGVEELWSFIQREVSDQFDPQTEDELVHAVQEVFKSLPQRSLEEKCVDTFLGRCSTCASAGGQLLPPKYASL